MATTKFKTALFALTHLSILLIILGSLFIEPFSTPNEMLITLLVALLASEILIVYENRISKIHIGPLEIDLGNGSTIVKADSDGIKTVPERSDQNNTPNDGGPIDDKDRDQDNGSLD